MAVEVDITRVRAHLAKARNEDGQVLVMMIFAMVVLLLVVAFSIDSSMLIVARHKAQIAADAGALAAAQDMESGTVNNATVTTDGRNYASSNDPGSTATITQPNAGNEAAVHVQQTIALPFGTLWGEPTGTVGASATAQVTENTAEVVDGDINQLTPSGSKCTGNTYCEIDATQSCASEATQGYNAYGGYFYWGPQILTSSWNIYSGYNTSTTKSNCSSVDVQDCNGAVGGNCLDTQGNQITNDEVVDLNGDSTGGMYQTVNNTVAGGHYVLTFWLTGNPAGESCSHDTFTGYVQISNNGTTGTQLAYQTFSHTNPCSGNSETAEFEEVTVPFIAQSANTTIILESTTCMSSVGGSDNCGSYWDFGPEVTDITLAAPSIVLVQ